MKKPQDLTVRDRRHYNREIQLLKARVKKLESLLHRLRWYPATPTGLSDFIARHVPGV